MQPQVYVCKTESWYSQSDLAYGNVGSAIRAGWEVLHIVMPTGGGNGIVVLRRLCVDISWLDILNDRLEDLGAPNEVREWLKNNRDRIHNS